MSRIRNRFNRKSLVRSTVLASLACAAPAFAQDKPDIVAEDKVKEQMKATAEAKAKAAKENKTLDGWKYDLNLGFNGGYTQNSSVVGQADGSTWQIGGVLNGGADLYAGNHEWHNALVIAHQQTQTPVIDGFIKTADNFELTSMWLYKLKAVPWLGPFARARFQTQLFPGALVFGEDTAVQFRDAKGVPIPTLNPDQAVDGSQVTTVTGQQRVNITQAFEPFTMRQSVGAFARAVEEKTVKVTFTLGLGAQEVFVSGDGGFAVTDDDATPQIELTRLQDSIQVGIEVGMDAAGTLGEQVTWALSVNTMQPFFVDAETDLEGLDLLNVETIGKIGVKLAKWVSLDYVLTARKIPLIVDEWQIQNSVLLSTAFNLL